MKNLRTQILNFLLNEDGPTAVEYAVMLALIILVCLIGITALGQQTSDAFNRVNNGLAAAS